MCPQNHDRNKEDLFFFSNDTYLTLLQQVIKLPHFPLLIPVIHFPDATSGQSKCHTDHDLLDNTWSLQGDMSNPRTGHFASLVGSLKSLQVENTILLFFFSLESRKYNFQANRFKYPNNIFCG